MSDGRPAVRLRIPRRPVGGAPRDHSRGRPTSRRATRNFVWGASRTFAMPAAQGLAAPAAPGPPTDKSSRACCRSDPARPALHHAGYGLTAICATFPRRAPTTGKPASGLGSASPPSPTLAGPPGRRIPLPLGSRRVRRRGGKAADRCCRRARSGVITEFFKALNDIGEVPAAGWPATASAPWKSKVLKTEQRRPQREGSPGDATRLDRGSPATWPLQSARPCSSWAALKRPAAVSPPMNSTAFQPPDPIATRAAWSRDAQDYAEQCQFPARRAGGRRVAEQNQPKHLHSNGVLYGDIPAGNR